MGYYLTSFSEWEKSRRKKIVNGVVGWLKSDGLLNQIKGTPGLNPVLLISQGLGRE